MSRTSRSIHGPWQLLGGLVSALGLFAAQACEKPLVDRSVSYPEVKTPQLPTLTITKHGRGSIKFEPQLADCKETDRSVTCRVPVARVNVIPTPGSGHYFWRWSRAASEGWDCSAQGHCTISFTESGAARNDRADVYFSPRICNGLGLCWENPLPQGNDLHRLWAAEGQLWIVGKAGTILHYDGEIIEKENIAIREPEAGHLRTVFGTSSTDVWAAGDGGVILQRSLGGWKVSTRAADHLLGGWSQSRDLAWIVGANGTILRWDGTRWNAENSGTATTLRAIWGDGSTLWAVGEEGKLLQRTEGGWNMVASPTAMQLNTIWGSGPKDIWAAGDNTTLLHYDGVTWTVRNDLVEHRLAATQLHDLWGSDASNVWLAAQEAAPWPLEKRATILHYDGSKWSIQRLDNQQAMSALVGLNRDEIWAVGERGTMMRWSARPNYVVQGLRRGVEPLLKSVWAAQPNRAMAVGYGGVILDLNYQPNREVYDTNQTQSTKVNYHAVAGRNTEDIWVAGDNGTIMHFDGQRWERRQPAPGVSLFGLFVDPRSQSRVFAVGNQSTVVEYTLTTPRVESVGGTIDLFGAWPDGELGLWLTGNSTILQSKRPASLCSGGPLPSVRFLGRVDGKAGAFVVGDRGTVLRKAPSSKCFEPMTTGVTDTLTSVDSRFGSSAEPLELWAVGGYGTVLILRNGVWERWASGTHQHLNAISFCSSEEVWMVGDYGTVLHRRPPTSSDQCRQAEGGS